MWNSYENGNYKVYINDEDGSKYRITEDDKFEASFPESMDIKITNNCDRGCLFCHEDSTVDGKHADINQKFIDSLRPFQEVAIGGGNILNHPDLDSFLLKLKDNKVLSSITINQEHFLKDYKRISELYNNKLVKGIGVSLTDSSNKDFISALKTLPTSVIHVINGVFDKNDLYNLKDNDLKILFLGYKNIRRGESYLKEEEIVIRDNQEWLRNNLEEIYKSFSIVSFDNLAVDQLKVKHSVDSETWNLRYMGDDGNFTFYIDMVEKEFAKSSTSLKRYPIENKNIDDMFKFIRDNR